ncbi:hypothetical protein BX661DRAFT_46847 [Kickxella alabastrina]|uniref:uncharacterized protein n=1 Tax=Kickxella alabastrina TaxID=61397 RepID=UPI00221EC56F|nr:uncharacterized protein BX661DRAFT_46847 [Kickxella alabastrina]KAI7824248.1 hypothetical protein BX661DRAFT_46847 [Kickxella alabastrina]KAJ1943659.1 hypothetical protein GGF37_002545 [Kickxella alabastrina]
MTEGLSYIFQTAAGFILTALCWGFTNPFIKRGSKGLESIKRPTWLSQTLAETYFLFTNWKYLLPLLLNLSGSAVYYYTLSSAEITIAVPITNSLALIFTILSGMLLGEPSPTRKELTGMFCIVSGVALCITS